MVNRGRSGGCVTCKDRHVKCDETKPECELCLRLGLQCGGYTTKPAGLRFRDQSHKFRGRHRTAVVTPERAGGIRGRPSVFGPTRLTEPDTAVPFFLMYYASMGRDMGSTRGFFEMLIPVYHSQPQNSALSVVLSAVGSELLSLWRHGPSSFLIPRMTYFQAIRRLRNATDDPIERSSPATMLAALVMQFHENLAALYGLRSPTRVHHGGAASLLPFADSDSASDMVCAYLKKFMLHIEVSSALGQNRPLRSIASAWLDKKHLMPAPENPSSALDAIGASVAGIQANYKQLATQENLTMPSRRTLGEWRAEAKRIDNQLLAWKERVPDYWQPLELKSGQDIDLSVPTYRSVCEVYPSCQIASIWNLWRFQRLILTEIALNLLNMIMDQGEYEPLEEHSSDLVSDDAKEVQTLVDSVCHSVPFYLGNRTKASTIADFDDLTILLPSYFSLDPGDKRRARIAKHDHMASRLDQRRHAIAQGPWHIMVTLSRLLIISSPDHGELIASLLRPGQRQWIGEQFLRVTTLLRLEPEALHYSMKESKF